MRPVDRCRRHSLDFKRVGGGLLVQDADVLLNAELKVVTKRAPTEKEMDDLLFAWRVAKFVKSNAIVYCERPHDRRRRRRPDEPRQLRAHRRDQGRARRPRGAGLGDGHRDAFFPFRDGIDQAAAAGIKAVIQPGGSMRDDEVIAAADEHGIAMVFTGTRHFRH